MPSTNYNLIYIYKINDEAHKGMLKIGKASLQALYSPSFYSPNCEALNNAAKKRIDGETVTAGIAYVLLYTELAVRNMRFEDGTSVMHNFMDDDVKDVLKSSGIKMGYPNGVTAQEWYETNLATAINAIAATKEWRTALTPAEIVPDNPSNESSVVLREEQEDAVNFTLEHMSKSKRVLWNAKMRFGKTLTALEVVKRKGFKRTLIVTHRPVVGSGWQEDFHKIFKDSKEYTFHFKRQASGTADEGVIDAENDLNLKKLVANNEKFIYFASIQDLRGSARVDGPHNKNNMVFDIEWDLIINDEAHEGTQTDLGKDVFEELLLNPKTGKQSTKTVLLALSGTPFNILDQYNDNVYTWDYVMEQDRKAHWNEKHPGEPNPYADLPQMHIYTYSLGKLIPGYWKDDLEGKTFNFYEFFRTWTGDIKYDRKPLPIGAKVGDFVHADDVRSFLNLIVEPSDSKYPFSTQEYRDLFRHTLWILPGVKEARALSTMLKEHPVFGQIDDAGKRVFGIINVAGDGDAEQNYDDALLAVRDGIKEYEYTITLSCGKLTTGVTVKEWTAVMMLAGTSNTAASGYMQTIFRVQSAGKINGKQKTDCYVFDFAPDRTLSVLAEAAHVSNKTGRRGKNEEQNRKAIQDFLNFCPVIAIDGTEMKPYSVNAMMEELKHIFVSKAIRNGFDDYSIYNDSLLDLSSEEWYLLNGIEADIGNSKRKPGQSLIDVNVTGFDGPVDNPTTDNPDPSSSSQPSTTVDPDAEEKKRKRKERDKAISILRAISIRMPLLIYGADVPFDDDITIEKFALLVDDESWKEFMPDGITKERFAQITKFYDRDVFVAAGREIRKLAKFADTLSPTERVKKITEIFNYFKNPDKETVLTPWRVVNMHISDTIGGWCFYNEKFEEDINNKRQHIINRLAEPRFVDHGEVTKEILSNPNARILEINSKSGLYPLYVTYSIYRAKLGNTSEEDWSLEQLLQFWAEAVKDNIFVVCKTPMAAFITRRTIAGYRDDMLVNTRYFDDLINVLKENPNSFYDNVLSCAYWNKEGEKMNFDAIVGNPPYQILDGGGKGYSAIPVYNLFIDAAKYIEPKYISMITPSRWFSGGKGLEEFRNRMLQDDRTCKIVDFVDNEMLFKNVAIAGGVNYFLWDNSHHGDCEITSVRGDKKSTLIRSLNEFEILIRNNEAVQLIRRIKADECKKMDEVVYARNVFGISSDFKGEKVKDSSHPIKLYCSQKSNSMTATYISDSDVVKEKDLISKYKVIMGKVVPRGGEVGIDPKIGYRAITTIQVLYPDSVFTDTYLLLSAFDTEEEAINFAKYMTLRFPRFLLHETFSSMNISKSNFRFVPFLDYSQEWSDEQLFQRFNCSNEEKEMIQNTMRPLEYILHKESGQELHSIYGIYGDGSLL